MPAFRRIEFKHRLQYSETTVLKEQEKIKGGRGIERKWEMEKKEKRKERNQERGKRRENTHTIQQMQRPPRKSAQKKSTKCGCRVVNKT